MNCPSCSHPNREGAKFCEECATPLKRVCTSCGAELRPTAKFCDECATPVGGGPPPAGASPVAGTDAGARKVVTILFADLAGSTALHERLDPESARRFMERYYAAARTAVEGYGGVVTQLLGDGVKAVFGVPRVAEDDALRAVRAAVAMQESFRALAEAQRAAIGETGLRVAVNTGEVVAKDETEIIGDPVNVAARLQEQGRDGDVVIGGSTEQLVGTKVTLEPLGSFSLKGRTEQVKAYRVVSLDAPDAGATTEFVGRAEELGRISDVYDTAVDKPAASLCVVLGSAGLGKSRLIEELQRRVGDTATIVHADCDEAGSASFAPLAGALRERLGLDADAASEVVRAAIAAALPEDDERERIVDGIEALLAARPAAPEETFFVVRRLLVGLAALGPVVLVIDDLQWAEPLLLDLVEHLVQWGSGLPLLLLIGARPELRDVRSSLAVPGGLVSDVVVLTGLDASAATRLAANVIGASDLPSAVAAKVLAASEGNPLFVGELVRMLVHEGALTKQGDRWTTGTALEALEMPPTIQALLAARIERLDPAERTVLEHASIVGRAFSRSAVAELLPGDGVGLDAQLEALQRGELIERDNGWFLGEPVLRFHHVLIRDAAYGRILKGTRADLHARFGDWVEARAGESVEHDETIGWHFEQAHVYLGELGPLDEAGRVLGVRASERLAAAGRRALERDDVPLAASLLGRSLGRLDTNDPARAALALDWCEALLAAGDVGPAAEAIDELGRFAGESDRLSAWHTCFKGQHTVLTAPEALDATADAVAEAAKTLAAQDDAAGEAKAHYVNALALQRLGRVGACEAALDRALAAARRVDDRRRANTVLAIAPLAALWGPSPVTRASGRCLDVVRVLRITQGAPAVEAVALSCQGVLEALRGRTDAARRMIASAREMVQELGITHRLLEADVFAGRVELLEGDAPAAERWLRPAYEGLRDAGLGIDAAQAAALLARALLAQDRVQEAEALSRESESLAGDDLAAAIAWRGVRAEALARRGEHTAAVEFASQAVEIASATDALLDHAEARLAFAAALRASGRAAEAAAEEQRARELWTAKGASVLVEPSGTDDVRPAPPTAPADTRRHVRRNRSTASLEEFATAIDAGDTANATAWFTDDSVTVEHTTGVTLGAREQRATWTGFLRAGEHSHRLELLASLGESLAMAHQRLSISGQSREGFESFGAAEIEKIVVQERHPTRPQRIEIFGPDRLGPALARMYELYAEEQPAGRERTRAEETARSVGVYLGDFDFDRLQTRFAPDVDVADHRTLGFGSFRGAERLVEAIGALLELTDGWENPVDDVLAATEHALLIRWTNSGTDRSSGGRFERPLLELWVFGEHGLCTRWERFDPGHEREAHARFATLARFDALAVRESPGLDPHFENLATRHRHSVIECIHDGDWQRLELLLSEDLCFSDLRRLVQVELDRAGFVDMARSLVDGMSSRSVSIVPLATRGERLALWRTEIQVAGGDVGPSELSQLSVIETDERGERVVFWARFDADDVDAAYAELDARYDAVGAEANSRTWANLRAFVSGVADRDWDAIGALCAEAFVEYDHRSLATLGTTHGGESWARNFQTLAEEAPGTTYRVDHFLPCESGFLTVGGWRGTREGGPYDIPLHAVLELDANDLIVQADIYDDVDTALGRLAELNDTRSSPAPFENAASRADAALFGCFNARDWAGVEALAAPGLVFDERRRLARNTCGREVWLEQFRVMFDLPQSRFRSTLVATRGERLALNLHRFESNVAGGGGPLVMEDHPVLHEVDAEGRIVAIVLFDLDDLDAAYAELDARFEAGEGATLPLRSGEFARITAGADWDALTALCARDLVAHDHRALAVMGVQRGRETWIESERALVEVAPGTELRVDHLRACSRGTLFRATYHGSRDGADYEIPFIGVSEIDTDGLLARIDLWDPEQLDAPVERFAEIAGRAEHDPGSPEAPRANAATRRLDRGVAYWRARDWEQYAALLHPDFRCSDLRRHSQVELDREGFVSFTREVGDRPSSDLVCTPLAPRGERLLLHRSLISFHTEGGGRSEIESLDVSEVDDRSRLVRMLRFDPDAIELATEALDARWRETAPHEPARTSPIAGVLSPNAANRGFDRFHAAYEVALASGDWEPMRRVAAREVWFDDRRRFSQVSGGYDLMVASLRERAEAGSRLERAPLATAGDRVAIERWLWSGGPADGRFEIEYFCVGEIDAEGALHAGLLFDIEDARAAQLEAWSRWAALDPVAEPATRLLTQITGAFEEQDRARFAAAFSDDATVHDHRHASLGRLEVDAYVDSVAAIWELAPDTRVETLSVPAHGRHGFVAVVRRVGILADGGDYEAYSINVYVVDHGRFTRSELFELEDLERALACFEELSRSAAAAAVSSNAASAAFDRFQTTYDAALESGDWSLDRELVADDIRFEDRRRFSQVSGGRELAEASMRERGAMGARLQREPVGTAGDRIAVERWLWSGGPPDGRFEIEYLGLSEVDESGAFCAFILFDADDTRAAQIEAWSRWAALDRELAGWVSANGVIEAFNARDREAIRGYYAPDAAIVDHLRTGIGRVEGVDAWLDAISTYFEVAPDTRLEVGWELQAWAPHGAVCTTRRTGTVPDGGAFEAEYCEVIVVQDGLIQHEESFELDALDRALARFEELRPDPLRIPPNAATNTFDRWWDIVASGRPEDVAVLFAPEFATEDRRAHAQLVHGVEGEVFNARWLHEGGWRPKRTVLATAGDRLSLLHLCWTTGEPGAASQIDALHVHEVDDDGRFVRGVNFDLRDRAAASAELLERSVALEETPLPLARYVRAWNDHDLERVRPMLPDYFDDQRRTGVGRLAADDYVESLRALFALSDDVQLGTLYQVATAPHGVLWVNHWLGTNAEDGEVEAVFVSLVRIEADRIVGIELYELDDLERARARFGAVVADTGS